MAGSFHDRMQHLIDSVGAPGSVRARTVVDQVYAKYQELREDLKHPEGGEAHALQSALYTQLDEIMHEWADGLITVDGCELVRATERIAEKIASGYFDRAPFEFGDLRASTHPTVEDSGGVVYDRPPGVGRLSTADLRAKGDLRRLGFGHAMSDDQVLGALGVG